MPRPKSLTERQLASAALAVIDRGGAAALSMRAVAAELGMSTMSLYRYVDDRGQLEELVVDLVLLEVDVMPPPGRPWHRQIAELMARMREAVSAHPESVPLTLRHRHASAGVLRWSEAVLGVLTEAGFDGTRRVVALRGLLAYLIGALQAEHLGPLSGAGTTALAALPADRYPLLGETARSARSLPADEEFREGLELMLTGLRAGDAAGGRP